MEFRLFSDGVFFTQFFMREGMLILLCLQSLAISQIRNSRANIFLALFFLMLAIVLFNDNEVLHSIGIYDTKCLNRLLWIPTILIPSSMYFAVRYFVEPNRELAKKDLIYIAPWALNVILFIPFIFDSNIKDLSVGWSIYAKFFKYLAEFTMITLSSYIWFRVYTVLKKHVKRVKLLHSSSDSVDLKWLLNIIILAPILIVAHILRSIYQGDLYYDISDVLIIALVLYMGVNLVKQREIYPLSLDKINLPMDKVTDTKGVVNEKLVEDFKVKATELENVMSEKSPYLNPNLNLAELAFLLDMKPAELSQLLNTSFSTNFYSYINKYRVEQCKEMLINPSYSHLSMEGIALEAGFKSKSTFYTRFKELEGLTPSQYQHTH